MFRYLRKYREGVAHAMEAWAELLEVKLVVQAAGWRTNRRVVEDIKDMTMAANRKEADRG